MACILAIVLSILAMAHILAIVLSTIPAGIPHTHTSSSRKPSRGNRNNAFFGLGLGKNPVFNGGFGSLRSKKPQQSRRRAAGPLRVVYKKVVGIDLGTMNSAVAAMEGGNPTIITNAEGQRTTPSVVAYSKNDDCLIGKIAKRQAVVNPENTFFSVKRFIGRKMSEVSEESKKVSYHVVHDDNGNVKLDFPTIGKQFAVEEIFAQAFPYQCLRHCK